MIREFFRNFERAYIRPLLQKIKPKKNISEPKEHTPDNTTSSAIDQLTIANVFEGFRNNLFELNNFESEYLRLRPKYGSQKKCHNILFRLKENWDSQKSNKQHGLFETKPPRQIRPLNSYQCNLGSLKRILIDLRCLQDPNYIGRGVGSHAWFLLEQLYENFQDDYEIIGLIDPNLGTLHANAQSLCLDVRTSFALPDSQVPTIFLELSPMTHDTRLPALLLDRPNIFPVTVIYDFIPSEHPTKYLAKLSDQISYQAALKWLSAYQLFLSISEHSAGLLHKKFSIEKEQIKVTGVALRPVFESRLSQKSTALQNASQKTPVILFAGGPDDRKGLETALDAHAELQKQGLPEIELVVVGNYPHAWQQNFLSGRNTQAQKIQFLERISDEELADWYEKATVTVSASMNEGFSMPVIEALACGSPVVVSDIPAHQELVQDNEYRFPVKNARVLSEKLKPFFTSSNQRRKAVLSQQSIVRKFTKHAVAKRFCEALHEQIRQPVTPSLQVKKKIPRIAIVSPFPPDRSGIADYTKKTIEALSKHAEVDLYTDQSSPVKTSGIRATYPISAAAWLRPDYDSTLSVIGNSHFHTKIIELHAIYGGPCLVHDNRLAELFAWWKGLEHLRRVAEESLKRTVEISEVRSWMDNPGKLPSMFYEEIIHKACPLLVHSKGIQKNVFRLYGVDAVYLPFSIYRNFKPDELTSSARQAARSALKIPEGQKAIVTLGIVDRVKLPHICIEAISELRRSDQPVHLYFVGKADSIKPELSDFAHQVGVNDYVHFSPKWIGEKQYYQYLVAADAGIQLRNSFFGGLSGALLDCIAAGLPTVANSDLANAMEGPEYVYRVSDEPSVVEVSKALIQALNTQRCEKHELMRSHYQKAHSFAEYSRHLLKEILHKETRLDIAS